MSWRPFVHESALRLRKRGWRGTGVIERKEPSAPREIEMVRYETGTSLSLRCESCNVHRVDDLCCFYGLFSAVFWAMKMAKSLKQFVLLYGTHQISDSDIHSHQGGEISKNEWEVIPRWKLERRKVIEAKGLTAPLDENFVLDVHEVVY